MTSISIALASFNGEKFLTPQLDSLARQIAKPSELVVCDDGSTDNTIAIIREFARTSPFPVHIIQNQARLGYRVNFMKATELCSSELIAFCDQDDIWAPNKLSVMQRHFENPDVLLAFHNATLVNESGIEIGRLFPTHKNMKTYAPLGIRPDLIVPGLTQIIRRSLLRFTPLHSASVDPYCFGERMPHDQWYPFWASILGEIVCVADSVVQYRQHGANTSGWMQGKGIAFILDHIRNAENYICGNAMGTKNRLQLLHQARSLLTHEELAYLDTAIAYYQALALRNERRLSVYKAGSLTTRAWNLAALVRTGAYTGNRSDSLGLDALLLDICIGVPFTQLGRVR